LQIRYEDLEELVLKNRPRADIKQLRKAWLFAARAHKDQFRASGDPYLTHPLKVAYTLAGWGADLTTVIAGLLHDVMEDAGVSRKELERLFGKEVAFIVEALTKLSRVRIPETEGRGFSSSERQVASILKLFLSSMDEPRILKVKLADRLHNMETLQFLPPSKQRRIAEETLTIYVPIAHMMGMGRVKGDLEDLCFRYLYPEEYSRLERLLASKMKELQEKLQRMQRLLEEVLKKEGIPFRIQSRVKRLYSIFRKMRRKGVELSSIDDLLALRVITDSVDRCYQILGIVHKNWPPIQGRLRDWIASPKPNGYRSLHTTIIVGGDKFEIQIRTEEMHREAELGSASHLAYKEDRSYIKEALDFVRELQSDLKAKDLIKNIGRSLEVREVIYVQTPKGHTIELPAGSTPLDFAYAIHTEIGHHAVGARVNGLRHSLKKPLQSGQVVEIITDPKAAPSVDWLNFVKTQRARQKIKSWFRKTEKSRLIPQGKKIWEEFLQKNRKILGEVTEEDLEKRLRHINIKDLDYFYYLIGKEAISPSPRLLRRLFPEKFRTELRKKRRVFRKPAVIVDGYQDIEVEFAGCCKPIKGDEIFAYVTKRGIKIHTKTCPLYLQGLLDPSRIRQARWVEGEEQRQTVSLEVKVIDRPGMLKDLLELISRHNINVVDVRGNSVGDGTGVISISFEIKDKGQWNEVFRELNSQDEILNIRVL